MTYKDTLFFIGKCLTISHEPENCKAIESKLKTGTVNWDSVVKVSTAHYVFPALYLNLQRAGFLHYLPEDLVGYMAHITDLNRERNTQIITQAKEINELLIAEGITPIFLKGTGNLLEGLYEDIGERMVGDIDFIVEKRDYLKTVNFFISNGYETVVKDDYHFPQFKHFPRLYKEDTATIAGIEIHKELLAEKYANEFNFDVVKEDIQLINKIFVLSYANQLNLSIIAKQINDFGEYYKNISLRNAYDVFLLSKKTDAKKSISIFNKIHNPLNCFLALCYEVLGKVPSINYEVTKKTKRYVELFYKNIENEKTTKKFFKKASIKVFLMERLDFIRYAIFNNEYRKWIFKRFTDKKWQRKKLIQLGIIKNK